MTDEDKKMYEYPEKSQALRAVCTVVLLIAGLSTAYWMFPEGIGDVPLAKLTLKMIGNYIWSIAIAIGTVGIAGSLWD